MKKETRLYNVLFPIWFFFLIPYTWLVILPGNFAIDSLVLLLAMRHCGIGNRKTVWKQSIWKVWAFGFLSDLIGAGVLFGLMFAVEALFPAWNIYLFPGTTVFSVFGVIPAGFLIYFFNRRFSFTKTDLTPEAIHSLSLALAVFTAPYTMLIPLYG